MFSRFKLLTFERKGRTVQAWYDYSTHRFVKSPPLFFWRATVTLNFVVANKYKSAILQKWYDTREEAYEALPELSAQLVEAVERYLKYVSAVWWFDIIIGKSVQDFPKRGSTYYDIRDV